MADELATRGEVISIHALREEGDASVLTVICDTWNFYPRPPRGGRRRAGRRLFSVSLFLSTPSARRATISSRSGSAGRRNFYPRPPRGGRLPDTSDKYTIYLFLSTPSARRATLQVRCPCGGCIISIHALREEGDALIAFLADGQKKFLSTPSARRAT